jgi:hypothetical protein
MAGTRLTAAAPAAATPVIRTSSRREILRGIPGPNPAPLSSAVRKRCEIGYARTNPERGSAWPISQRS